MQLPEFLVKAKIATYASEGEANEQVLEDGAKELTFEENNFRYRDRYYGFNPFSGQELVWQDNALVWSMNYFGKVTSDDILAKQVYKFLQSAMRKVSQDRPFRGPSKFSDGDLTYTDESTGDINLFTGVEKIFFKDQEVYRLEYHGGSL